MRGEISRHGTWAVAALLILTLASPALAADPPQVTDQTLTEVETYLASQLADEGRPGLSAAIVADGETHTIELGESVEGVPVNEDSVFHVASLTKSLTAMAVALLVEDGLVSMSDPVTDYIRELRPGAEDVTIDDLMHQFSGLSEYVGNEAWVGPLGESIETNVIRLEPEFSPSAEWSYSNANYDTLALVVERVSGQPFAEFLGRRVLDPLQMGNTHVGPTGNVAGGHYYALFTGYRQVDAGVPPGLAGSAGAFSTPSDLAHFMMAQLDAGSFAGEQVVPESVIAALQTPRSYGLVYAPPPPVDPGYAGGLFVDASFGPEVDPELAAVTTLWHRGDSLGFQSAMWMMPEVATGFVLLTNGEDSQNPDWVVQVAQNVKHILFGLEPQELVPLQDPLQRWGKQLLLTLVVAQVLLAVAVLPTLQRRRSGRKLRWPDVTLISVASGLDVAALTALLWIIPDAASSPLRVVIQAPDYRVLVILIGAGVVWGILRTLMLISGSSQHRREPTAAE